MKPRSHWPFEKLLAFAAAYLSLTFACHAAPARTNAPARVSPLVTNATLIQVEIPQSVFVIPTSPLEGKDPFFPRSMRLFSSGVLETNVPLPTPSVELRLNGISATADRRLAIINNQTFEINEEGEVRTSQGRARIRCLEIKADSVLVQVGNERQVLHFRPGF